MLMYNTICKTNKNSDKTIADMITAGFTGQLKGWWDNYLNQDQRDKILQEIKKEGEQYTQNAVYTLVLNIIEHFSRRWSDNSETIRTLLQNLRCKTLTSFRDYKDVFLCRVMELPKFNSTHWKSKFIDGLATLFAERVRKSLRGDNTKKDFTLSNGEITKSVFPPQQTFHINRNDKVVNFNAFQNCLKMNRLVTTNVNAMIKNNYANIYMSILGEHIVSLNDKVDKLISLLPTKMKGKEKMAHSSLQPPPDIDNFKIKDYSDLEEFLAKNFKNGSLQPINARDFSKGETSHNKEFSDGINKILENYEHEYIITNSYNGKEIYEWNIDGYIDRQIYTTVHRMLMYNTICKTNKNSQLKEWWDNYLNRIKGQDPQVIKHEGEQDTRTRLYYRSNIIEHFSGRWSDNSETIRTLLQNLRCKTLTSFRYYKDQLGEFCEQFTFDIPKQKSKDKEYNPKKKISSKKDYEKWKKKRIEKKLRRAEEGKGDTSKRKKKYRHNYKKSDTCHKCGRFGHYVKDCKVKEKIKSLDNQKIAAVRSPQQVDYITSEDERSSCQQGLQCEKDEEEDDLYKIYSQFKELSLNVIDNDKVLELLQSINDPDIRAQIIDKISNNTPVKDHTPKEIPTKEGSYTMAEVKKPLLERRKIISSPTIISDLKDEINNLKEDIVRRRGGGGRSNSRRGGHILIQHGNKQLIAANSSSSTSGTSGVDINHPMYKKFMDFMKSKKESDNNPPTYSTILMDDENIEAFDLNDKI
ncbi:hypothetical protein H5410_001976 [Solanum commersonii]|uniref:CCHC-type domain-containing protein n=1 Tax=Solanum commersonii TaxID=4109 RepID=A0A9J6B135_SOLCO|nr:hypothetical protein H5410_001976 [Solanum commersonii]